MKYIKLYWKALKRKRSAARLFAPKRHNDKRQWGGKGGQANRGATTTQQINNVDHAHATTFNVISFEAPRACAGAKQSLDRVAVAGSNWVVRPHGRDVSLGGHATVIDCCSCGCCCSCSYWLIALLPLLMLPGRSKSQKWASAIW